MGGHRGEDDDPDQARRAPSLRRLAGAGRNALTKAVGASEFDNILGIESVGLATLKEEPKLKIEVLHSTNLRRWTLLFLAAIVYSIVHCVVFTVIGNLVWKSEVEIGPGKSYTFVVPPEALVIFNVAVDVATSLLILAITCAYVVAIFMTPRQARTREMVHVVYLALSSVLLFLPFMEFVVWDGLDGGISNELYLNLLSAQSIASGVFGACGIYYYAWSISISFRTKEDMQAIHTSYATKMFVILLFFVIRLLCVTLVKVSPNWQPFSTLFISIALLYTESHFFGWSQICIIILNTFLEAVMVFGIGLDLAKSHRYVKNLDYMHNRSTYIAFSQFKYYMITTFTVATITASIFVSSNPNDLIFTTAKYRGIAFFQPPYGRTATVAVVPVFVILQLYFMLPVKAPTALDFLLCRCNEPSPDTAQSLFSFRNQERIGAPTFKPTSFVLETCMVLMNIAWLPYTYGRNNFRPITPEELGDPWYKVEHYARGDETDTHAIILSSPDRIVVTFRGTASRTNLWTDFMNDFVHASILEAEEVDMRPRSVSGLRQSFSNQPMLHRGFALAYSSVKMQIREAVAELNEIRPRPVFCTGHSLGGALATVCSFDIARNMAPEKGVYVFTFGSPRVGNRHFCQDYNTAVPCHWRVVNARDPVTKAPLPLFYEHVGNTALLTKEGNLFVDPTFFELQWYHSTFGKLMCGENSIRRHYRPAYVNNLCKFAEKYNLLSDSEEMLWDISIALTTDTDQT